MVDFRDLLSDKSTRDTNIQTHSARREWGFIVGNEFGDVEIYVS